MTWTDFYFACQFWGEVAGVVLTLVVIVGVVGVEMLREWRNERRRWQQREADERQQGGGL